MGQLDFFEELEIEKDLRMYFKKVKVLKYTAYVSVIKCVGKDPYIAYVHWSDRERYNYNSTDQKIHEKEVEICSEFDKQLEKGFDHFVKAFEECA